MIIKTWRDPYDAGFSPTVPTKIELNPGLTVLVGCNGAGKTTLLHNIKSECEENKIPCHMYDNIRNGGIGDVFSSVLSGFDKTNGDSYGLASMMYCSSEGENIKNNLGRQARLYKGFLKNGFYEDKQYRLTKIFSDKKDEESVQTNIRVLLYDATDSGLSIDNIIEIKNFFYNIIEDSREQGLELYIIISANEYELCNNEQCFDVNVANYLTFADYCDYKEFIINSRVRKEKRIKKQEEWREKQYQKELKKWEEFKVKHEIELQKALERKKNGKSKWDDDDIIKGRDLRNFINDSRFLSEDLLESN